MAAKSSGQIPNMIRERADGRYEARVYVGVDSLEQTYNKVCEYLGWIQVKNINADDVQKMVNDLSRKKTYSTVKKHFELVNSVLFHAYNAGEIERNLCNAVVLPKERNMTVKTKQAEMLSRDEKDAKYELNEKIKDSQNQQDIDEGKTQGCGWKCGK